MNLKDLQKTWDRLGAKDALWSILTHSGKKGHKWNTDEFYATGMEELKNVFAHTRALGIKVYLINALDFGCGAGRVTQALAKYFDEVHGVDIAPSMIEFARQHNYYPYKCMYHLNRESDLKLFKDNTFSFVYSNITLQHIIPAYTKRYIREFMRILAPGGVLVFQLPSEPAFTLKGLMIRLLPNDLLTHMRHGMEMYSMKKDHVIQLLNQSHATIVDIQHNENAGKGWVSLSYYVIKK
jgi:ubiquinone/menaquinone biosynthesis C-methylase UbiE